MADYPPNEIVDIIISYGASGENAREAARHYAARFPNRRHPNASRILRLLARAREGALRRQRRRRQYDDDNDPEILAVIGLVVMNPHISQREICHQLNMSLGTVNRIVRANRFHPYCISLHQALTDNDHVARVIFCRWALDQIAQDPTFFYRVLFSDEATFKNDRTINRHNCHYYSQTQPHYIRHIDHQHPWKLNVWCGIMNGQLIGPHFFERDLDGPTYLHFLQTILPNLLEDVDLDTRRRMFMQQDGAPPHWSRAVRAWLDAHFPGRWIGRGSQIAWPPRSPDLTSLDFFLWGYLKGIIYATPPETREDMRQRIMEACRNVPPIVLRNTVMNFERRLQMCVNAGGGTFEQLL